MYKYNTYTIAELRAWLMEHKQNGISEWAIDPCRAYAFINNPCAKDDDPALVVVFDDKGEPVGYTGAFAEDFVEGNIKGRFFWGSTEWLNPSFRGQGIAASMMDKIKVSVGYDKYLALESSEASVRLDKKQGSEVKYYPRIKYKLFSKNSIKETCYSYFIRRKNKKSLIGLNKYQYRNQYVTFIDEETYDFIRAHAQKDLFLRKRDMFNWMLHYPFLMPVDEDGRAEKSKCEFGSVVRQHSWKTVKVLAEGVLRGVYIISQTDKVRTLRYLYYEKEYKELVFASMANNMIYKGVEEIRFFSEDFHEFLSQHSIKRLNRKTLLEPVSYTFPNGMMFDKTLLVQGGDGDMFC